MPASRSARAMIFAPRSWPSNPGFAMTTRIFRATVIAVGEYMDVRLTVIGSSPAWPNPGSAQSGYLVEGPGKLLLDCGPGVLGRLRENGTGVQAIAITHWHLDHWGDLVPWAWLNAYGPPDHRLECSVWVPPRGIEELTMFASRWGNEGMFERAFELHEYDPQGVTPIAGFEVEAQR